MAEENIALWGWDAVNNVWVKLQVTAAGLVRVDLTAVSLNDLGDVNAPAPADGEVLTWDAGTGLWIPVAPAVIDPEAVLDYWDDFICGTVESGEIGILNWTRSATTRNWRASEANHPGIFYFGTSAVLNNVAYLTEITASLNLILPTDLWDFTYIVRIPDITTVTVFVGAMNNLAAAVGNQDRYGFEFVAATDANWTMVTGSGAASTRTATDIPVVVATWYKLRVVRTATGVDYYVDDVLKGSIALTLPDTSLALGFQIQTNVAAKRNLDCDFFRMKLEGITR